MKYLTDLAIMNVAFDSALHGIQSSSLSRVREKLINFCINILYSYRKFCVSPPSSGPLILPESLKLLPLYTIGKFSFLLSTEIFLKTKSLFMG